ncbi:MAG: methyltransferase domain-containing protein [Acidobacteria bacterium]|nr:MAG: methyltransferase domain-containing protein [Acidobacteriota bacterium]
MSEALTPEEQKLRTEFNDWAAHGKGASMARHHRAITERMFARIGFAPGDRVLDLGCGSGWATRLAAERVGPQGLAVGVDVSDAMIAQAADAESPLHNTRFVASPADHIPWSNNFFRSVFSVESFYYYPDPRAVLDELKRVLVPGGGLFLLMCLYTGNPNAKSWIQQLAVPVQYKSTEEWRALLADAGWADARIEEFRPDPADKEPDEHAYACLAMARKP